MELNPAPIENLPKQDRRTWWATLFLLCGILGAMLGLSVRTQQVIRHDDGGRRATTLLIKAGRRPAATHQSPQQDRITKYEAGHSCQHRSDTAPCWTTCKSAKFLAGLTAVKGPGIIVTLNDSKNPFPSGLPPGYAPPNIIHDTDINQVVNELKAAGAEAVSVNDQRLVAVSPVRCAGPTVFVNNTQRRPRRYIIKAIGDPKTLADGAQHVRRRWRQQIKVFDPAMLKMETRKASGHPGLQRGDPAEICRPG